MILLIAACNFAMASAVIATQRAAKPLALNPMVAAAAALGTLFGVVPIYRSVMRAPATLQHLTPDRLPGLLAGALFIAGFMATCLVKVPRRHGPTVQRGKIVYPSRGLAFTIAASATLAGVVGAAVYVKQLGGLPILLSGRTGDPRQHEVTGALAYSPLLIPVACAALILSKTGVPHPAHVRWLSRLGMASALLYLPLGNRRFIIPCILLPLLALRLVSQAQFGLRQALLVTLAALVVIAIPYLRASGAREAAGGWQPILVEFLLSPATSIDSALTGVDTNMYEVLSLQIRRSEPRYSFGLAAGREFVTAVVPASSTGNPTGVHDEILIDMYGARCTEGRCDDSSIVGSAFFEGGWFGLPLAGALFGTICRMMRSTAESSTLAQYCALVATIFAPICIRAGATPAAVWAASMLVPGAFVLIALRAPRARLVVYQDHGMLPGPPRNDSRAMCDP